MHIHNRVVPSRTLLWFGLGVSLFLISIIAFNIPEFRRDGAIVGFCALSGLFLLIWKGKEVIVFLLTPRQLAMDASGLAIGNRTLQYGDIVSLQLDHDSDKLTIRCERSPKLVLRLDFWSDSDAIYDELANRLTARLGSSIERRIRSEGSVEFGKVVATSSDLKYKSWVVPYADIGSIRMQHEGSNTGSMDYLVIRVHAGWSCKIDRSSIVNEAVLLDFLSRRLSEQN